MRRGPWHQFGDRSQKLAREQLHHGAGVGTIVSPRDLSFDRAIEYATDYHGLGADVLLDPQFYYPEFMNSRLETYPISEHRHNLTTLAQASDRELAELATKLAHTNAQVHTDAVIAPAVVYEAGRQDIVQLNERLFYAARTAAHELDLPVLATVMLGRSTTTSDTPLREALSNATSLGADGWYFGFQFDNERLPTSIDDIVRCGQAILALACTGKPVLHAYAGPLGLLSFGMGATGAGIGHFQNLWQFSPTRWQQSTGQGGGGDAPPRFFSTSLWGTIIYPDELAQLPQDLANQIVTPSPFSGPVGNLRGLPWSRWDANKHLVFSICHTLARIASDPRPQGCAQAAADVLANAIDLHRNVKAQGIDLADDTDSYQSNWLQAIDALISRNSDDYDYLGMLIAA